ncbi:MAG: hypothetical protein ACTHY6_12660 [Corynebacterium variabile]
MTSSGAVIHPKRGDRVIVPLGPHGRSAIVLGQNLSGRIRVRVLWEDEFDDDPNVEPTTLSCRPEELRFAPGHPKS